MLDQGQQLSESDARREFYQQVDARDDLVDVDFSRDGYRMVVATIDEGCDTPEDLIDEAYSLGFDVGHVGDRLCFIDEREGGER